MSWWRNALGTVGDVAKFALPAAAFIPGVNIGVAGLAGLGAAAGAAGRLNDKRKDGSGRYEAITLGNLAPAAVKGGATGAIGGYLGGAGRGASAAGRLAGSAGGRIAEGGDLMMRTSSQGDALQRLLRGGGQAVNWLTDKDQGASRTALMTSLLSTGTGIMGGRAQGAVEDETMRFNRERTLAEEARKQKVLDLLMSRFGGDIR